MEMIIDFPGGDKVDAHFGSFTIQTDQPPESSAPTPFSTFLASLGTCAGIYVLGFCKQRGLPTEGIRIVQRMVRNSVDKGMIDKVEMEIQVPPDFPEKYYSALVRSADQCLVKKHFAYPPEFDIYTKAVEFS